MVKWSTAPYFKEFCCGLVDEHRDKFSWFGTVSFILFGNSSPHTIHRETVKTSILTKVVLFIHGDFVLVLVEPAT